jgi:hypothetical protein
MNARFPPHPSAAKPALPGLPSTGRARSQASAAALAGPLRELMLNTALLAAAHGMSREALRIKQLLFGLGVDRQRLDIAMAIVLLRRGDSQACLALIENDVLAREPDNALALAVQASAWRAQGLPQWRMHANAVLASSSDPIARSVARGAM